MNQQGKTVLELMLVVGLLGLAAVLTGEGFSGAVSRNHASVVRAEIASELRMARYMAITGRRPIRVLFEPGATRISTESVTSPPAKLRQYDFSGKGVTVEKLSRGPGVSFYPTGRAATPTTITLRRTRDGEQRQLTVSLTGRVRLK